MSRKKAPDLHILSPYQQNAVSAICSYVERCSALIEENPQSRRTIALDQGVCVLEAPTGSGKTLILGRALEQLRGSFGARKCIWFWFAPYSGLVEQSRKALAQQCAGLRGRDLYKDRDVRVSLDGDVFIHTWQAVAAQNKEAKRIRRPNEAMMSLDDLIAELRDRGWFIGAVVDEAHLNFGMNAERAADFYLNVLCPDFTLLASATPKDARLRAFREALGITRETNRISISRQDVVDQGLNKVGVMLANLRIDDGYRDYVDMEQAVLSVAWGHHAKIKQELRDQGIKINPLMLVQVEDDKANSDAVERVREKLLAMKIPDAAIATHTSGKPDPDFHTLAFDDEKEILIFKVAVATGFDAPRAWSLVSVRPSQGVDFGLQIVGRIMRVHPLVRPLHKTNKLLDRGYVFLVDPEAQTGINQAAEVLKAMRSSIELVSDQLQVLTFTPDQTIRTGQPVISDQAIEDKSSATVIHFPIPARSGAGSGELPGLFKPSPLEIDQATRAVAEAVGTQLSSLSENLNLFGEMPMTGGLGDERSGHSDKSVKFDAFYDLRHEEFGIPLCLRREEMPKAAELETLVEDVATIFALNAEDLLFAQRRNINVNVLMSDIFNHEMQRDSVKVQMSKGRLAFNAQASFQFNQGIDPRMLKRALLKRLAKIFDDKDVDYDDGSLKYALNMIGCFRGDLIKSAIKKALGRNVMILQNEPIPLQYIGPKNLEPAQYGAYGVFPHNMNKPERAFAEWLDQNPENLVRWWLRNPERERWAVRIILPDGSRHFPDFVVGVRGSKTVDSIRLVEVKDDGMTGRLHAKANVNKIRTHHRDYGSVLWVYQDGRDGWIHAQYNAQAGQIFAGKNLQADDLLWDNA